MKLDPAVNLQSDLVYFLGVEKNETPADSLCSEFT